MIERAVAATIPFGIEDASGDPVLAAAVTATLSLDGGAYTASTNAVAEVGSGDYSLDLTSAELDADVIRLRATDGTNETVVTITPAVRTDYALIAEYDPAKTALQPGGTLAHVTLVDTCTANSDMRGTDGANTTAPDNAGIAAAKAAAEAIAAAATEARLARLDVAVSTRATLGAGAIAWSYTITRSDTGAAIADVTVWVTSDLAGSTVLASGTTNESGTVTFLLDAGTVYVWRKKDGINFTNPDTEVVA